MTEDSKVLNFCGRFIDKETEREFLNSTLHETIKYQRYSILISGFCYLLVSFADYYKLGICKEIFFTISARIVFFIYCVISFLVLSKHQKINHFTFLSFLFVIGNTLLLLFVIYMLNPDKQIDTIDTVTLPTITLMITFLARMPIKYHISNSILVIIGYFILLFFLFDTSTDFIINMLGLITVLISVGIYLSITLDKNRRKDFIKSVEIKNLNEDLKKQISYRQSSQNKLETLFEELSESIRYAQKLQLSLLPSDEKFKTLSEDFFIYYKPKDIVSGDFYWISHFNNKSIIAVADCTGHGIPGAFMSVLSITLLNQLTKEIQLANSNYTASLILDYLRKEIIKSTQHNEREQTKDGMDISLCILDKENQTIQFAGAYNNLWILRKENDENKVIILKGDRMPIGTHTNEDVPFTNYFLTLEKNDLLVFATDGFGDQFGGPKSKRFQNKQLIEILLNNCNGTLNDVKKLLETTFTSWKGKEMQIDDILILGIRI
ncbi:MAG: SpoIIE family protein phosphatase [Bacteroidales bacterium]|nr:SpoIIE family protein phosphatase [Bacteroidales bacterium]